MYFFKKEKIEQITFKIKLKDWVLFTKNELQQAKLFTINKHI